MSNKVSGSNSRDFSKMTQAERYQALSEMSDSEIDYSDIASLDDEFLNSAKRVENPLLREKKSIRVKSQVLDWFRARAKDDNYETLINDVLESYIKKHQ